MAKKEIRVSYSTLTLILLALVFGSITVMYLGGGGGQVENVTTTISSGVAKMGDTISMDYVGRFTNGTAFDTSYLDVAKSEGIFVPERVYEPLMFVIGSGMMIPGLENQILGMKVGDEKTITVEPEDAYGPYDPMLMRKVNRTYSVTRTDVVPLADFERAVGPSPAPNTTVTSERVPWSMFVIGVNETDVAIRYDPEPDTTILTLMGNATVLNLSDSEVWLRENPVTDSVVMTELGMAKIVEFDDDTITLDFNHLLAGKTLIFDVKLADIAV